MNRPFDSARYEALLKGLEVTEVSLSAVKQMASTFRIDPEYFQAKHLADVTRVQMDAHRYVSFASMGLSVEASAFYPSIEEYYGSGDLPFLRVADVDEVIDFEQCTTVPASLSEKYPALRQVSSGDIVFTKGGSVARIGLVTRAAAVSRDLIFINTSKLAPEDQRYLYLYFQTPFFHRTLVRSSSQTAQPHLTITLVRDLPLFGASKEFKSLCAAAVDKAYRHRDSAIRLLEHASTVMLKELGLADWSPPEPLSFSRRASEVFKAGRLDAEFFSPRVTQLINKLSAAGATIGAVAPARRERFVPGADGEFEYIEIGGVRTDGTAVSERLLQKDAPSRATSYVRAGDVITSSVRPIRRLSALVDPSQDGAVCSSGFVVLRPEEVCAEVLLTYLRLPPVCGLMDLHTSASLYPAISEGDLLGIPFRPISKDAERQVVDSVRSSHSERKLAHALLDAAKAAVETAIEKDEPAAMQDLAKWLEE